jgi:zinc/manganese transport system ATP-binding protein
VSGPAIVFQDLTLGYDRHPAVHHVDGTVQRGDLLAVVGPNGAGKSTLLKGIAGTLRPLGGTLSGGAASRDDVAYLPQASEVDRSFPLPVYDLVAMGLWRRSGLFGAIGRKDRDAILAAIAAVGLAGFEGRTIQSLSGGQLQRVLFARLLLQDAAVILLDEPFTAIDAKTTADLLSLVARWHGEERTVIAVLHDLDLVRRHFPQTLLLAREPVAWGRTADVLTAENLLTARRMVEAPAPFADICERAA